MKPSKSLFHEFKESLASLVSNQSSSLSQSRPIQLPLPTNQTSTAHTRATFMAFADAVIPSTNGALDLRLDDYLIWGLDHYISIQGQWGMNHIQLSAVTAEVLDAGATQLSLSQKVKEMPNPSIFPEGGPFSSLSVNDRFEAIYLLEQGEVDMESLPPPFQGNLGLVENILGNLHQMILLGYYSEWFSLGTTRLSPPENRRIERPFVTWDLVHYPGPAYGYRDLRGFLVKNFSE
ncbi:hypothetical protein N0O92_17285 [Alkalihalobacillus sp. MEB130]|uniref:hypothetical protein n=1 Tax=Alkalihalobacillus sp. MEB130 TaxID=2976704 RepID=UPI0028DF8332|nr:hypothetical protein [Alkalihalobacillus sp. MEB130]MDT8861965.1 hypothetical protein [Alkalihalobacillus sp. MEB130]